MAMDDITTALEMLLQPSSSGGANEVWLNFRQFVQLKISACTLFSSLSAFTVRKSRIAVPVLLPQPV
jgi:hypothetical protein